MTERADSYGDYWDLYVRSIFPQIRAERDPAAERLLWPGDEWGTPDIWSKIFEMVFVPELDPGLARAVEIGPGAGKYTAMVLERYPLATVLAADVSAAYLAVLADRLAPAVAAGRLALIRLEPDWDQFRRIAAERGWEGTVDLVFSIDAMVHVDLQFLVAYWMGAAAMLRPGGKMIMSVADATSPHGFDKLIADVPTYFAAQGKITSKFEWLCPPMVAHVLDRLGFDVRFVPKLAGRDCWFVATRRAVTPASATGPAR
ncbi:MAG: class I SAM-dependent methyltransferase [Alphaproteobacteria bacterium]|nr:class I SAM-dependent methyltransferase [Alphaproteobacteria bacterium]